MDDVPLSMYPRRASSFWMDVCAPGQYGNALWTIFRRTCSTRAASSPMFKLGIVAVVVEAVCLFGLVAAAVRSPTHAQKSPYL